MAREKEVKILNYKTQVKLRKAWERLYSKSPLVNCCARKDFRDALENIILDYWGATGPDCMVGRLEAAI